MSIVIPSWLLWIAGGVGVVALIGALIALVFFAILGVVFYKAFSRGIWR